MTDNAASTHEITVFLRGLTITVKAMSKDEALEMLDKVSAKVASYTPPDKQAIDQFVR